MNKINKVFNVLIPIFLVVAFVQNLIEQNWVTAAWIFVASGYFVAMRLQDYQISLMKQMLELDKRKQVV